MRRFAINSLMALAVVAAPFSMIGCDTVEEEKKVEVKDDGTVVKEQTKTTENADGSVTKTEEKKVDKP